MVRDGTARVEVRALAAAPGRGATASASAAPATAVRTQATAAAPPASSNVTLASAGAVIGAALAGPTAPSGGRASTQTPMYVQVGAFGELGNAETLVARLRAAGFGSARVSSSVETGRTLHRVRVGPVASSSEFDAVREQLARAGFGETRLVVDR
jgi:rare lipoprotein A